MSAKQFVSLAVLLVLASFAGGALSVRILLRHGSIREDKMLVAPGFLVADSTGGIRAALRISLDGKPELVLLSKRQKTLGRFGLWDYGIPNQTDRPRLELCNDDGYGRASFELRKDSTPHLFLTDPNNPGAGVDRIHLSVDTSGTAVVEIQGKGKAGAEDSAEAGRGAPAGIKLVASQAGAPSVGLRDSDGIMRMEMILGANERPALNLAERGTGRLRASLSLHGATSDPSLILWSGIPDSHVPGSNLPRAVLTTAEAPIGTTHWPSLRLWNDKNTEFVPEVRQVTGGEGVP